MDKDKTTISLTYDQFVNLTWEEIEQLPEYKRKQKKLEGR
jgi:hypothetical protein